MFGNTLYVRVARNELRVKHLESGKSLTVSAPEPFTTPRLLVGRFGIAQQALRKAFRELIGGGLLAVAPSVVMQPLEMIEGGLSDVEERILRELAIGAGARKVAVWVGPPLSDDEVKKKAREGTRRPGR
jgi:rod shape-determining protein MreB